MKQPCCMNCGCPCTQENEREAVLTYGRAYAEQLDTEPRRALEAFLDTIEDGAHDV